MKTAFSLNLHIFENYKNWISVIATKDDLPLQLQQAASSKQQWTITHGALGSTVDWVKMENKHNKSDL